MFPFDYLKPSQKHLPSHTYFDHLWSEYESLKSSLQLSQDDQVRLEEIKKCRGLGNQRKLTWHDIYEFELMLLKYLKLPDLCNKATALRQNYKDIFGDKKYQIYKDNNPPDIPKANEAELQKDISFLLNEIHLQYAALYSRDGLSKWLTIWAAVLIVISLAVIGLLIFGKDSISSLKGLSTPIPVVAFAGALGGLISILQRLESSPADGEPIHKLAVFWHGSYALFVSPLTGIVFGVLIHLMFSGQVLEGRFFPRMTRIENTVCFAPSHSPAPTPSPSPSPSSNTKLSPTPDATQTPKPSPTNSPSPLLSPSPTATASPSPSPSQPTPTPTATSFQQFLQCTGPVSSGDYALLILWCFIAGFAERLIPDALSRLSKEANKESKDKKDDKP
jgi:hypothetical protein